ncbi:DNA-binding transcriptional regulator YhcF (GntR family) [Virgibacillus halotolerans]|uniref:GntR family transcriptional regulator n=1 Tax=Virgibacillus halotolerans TaxID=1071053 RepID=UPI00195FD91D|nr:GntR family transcriptional regulator [Virgibacillus halotolerans]MBM7599592.1 DNA-binding transcriptional regulator YhcF (GntR family) [Virgibacillus halotolerans]
MKANLNDQTPIFIQIADMIKDALVEGVIKEGEKIPSTTELSNFYHINRATAQKGVGILMDEGIVEKRRGIGIFVVQYARDKLIQERMQDFSDSYIQSLVKEAKRLDISKDDVIKKVSEYYDNY